MPLDAARDALIVLQGQLMVALPGTRALRRGTQSWKPGLPAWKNGNQGCRLGRTAGATLT
jgi:hypothetical protein